MKKLSLMIVAAFLIFASYYGAAANFNPTRTTIVIKESSDTYQLTASYDKVRTERVKRYINNCLKPEMVVTTSDDMDQDITLHDHTRFHISFSPGDLFIKININSNSRASVQRIRTLCRGLNDVINK
jgi:hypothetical protein